eukprot:scaffold292880_cov33-Tisochrysis_lutea.AAC.4
MPTSPSTRGLSESYPRCVARSKATERPFCPAARAHACKGTLRGSLAPRAALDSGGLPPCRAVASRCPQRWYV